MKIYLTLLLILFSSFSFSQAKDSLIFRVGKSLKVYKDLNSLTYKVKKDDKDIIHKNLKFVEYILDQYIQVITEKNVQTFINKKGEIEDEITLNIGYCGTVPHYTYEVKTSEKKHILTETISNYDYKGIVSKKSIDSIEIKGIDKINFPNNKKKVQFTNNEFITNYTKTFPYALIIQKGKKKGILYKGKLTYYDEISYHRGLLKVMINGKYGFYQTTEIKYKELDPYRFGLAKFKLIDNKIGYVDKNGNEYYK